MKWFFYIWTLFFISCWGLPDMLQEVIQPPSPEEMIGWVNYPDVFPNCMTDDLQGNIWMGGEVNGTEGLFRFDGKNWQRIPASVIGISEPVIVSDVYGADNGKVYVGFKDKGFAIYDGTVWKVYNKQSGLVSDSVTVIRIDKSSKIWIGTIRGIMQYDGVKWDTFTVNNGLPDNYMITVEIDGDNNVICLTPKGFAQFDRTVKFWIPNSPSTGDSVTYFSGVICDRTGVIWTGLSKPEPYYLIFYKFINGIWKKEQIDYLACSPGKFAFDTNNDLWLDPNLGIVKYSQGNITEYHSYNQGGYSNAGNSGLLDEYVKGIFIDRHNNKWFLTLSGLSKFELD
ncbi:MAG: hypothetical protein ABIL69_06730 [candidate division WOR-3 bacterium]